MQRMPIRVLIDGACPICRREAAFLKRLDRGRGRIAIEDIAAADFDAGRYGLTQGQVMARIHGILPGGEIVRGMEVFRRVYRALGWGWLVAPTGWPVLRPLFDLAYRVFAHYRPRVSGRSCNGTDACSPRNSRSPTGG